MGEDFSFNEWSETWLKTSGVNVLEPVLEYNDDFSVKSFGIKQTCDLRGQNRIRKMKLNAVFYDSDFKAHESKNIILSDKDAITNVNFEFKGPVKAIIINHDAHAYSKILFDQRTLDTFETDMNRISDALTRALIWRNVWNQVREAKFSSVQFFNMVLKSIQSETVEQIIVYVLSILNVVIKSYLPHQVREESARKLFELLFNWL
jgi:aminopeptidase N